MLNRVLDNKKTFVFSIVFSAIMPSWTEIQNIVKCHFFIIIYSNTSHNINFNMISLELSLFLKIFFIVFSLTFYSTALRHQDWVWNKRVIGGGRGRLAGLASSLQHCALEVREYIRRRWVEGIERKGGRRGGGRRLLTVQVGRTRGAWPLLRMMVGGVERGGGRTEGGVRRHWGGGSGGRRRHMLTGEIGGQTVPHLATHQVQLGRPGMGQDL